MRANESQVPQQEPNPNPGGLGCPTPVPGAPNPTVVIIKRGTRREKYKPRLPC